MRLRFLFTTLCLLACGPSVPRAVVEVPRVEVTVPTEPEGDTTVRRYVADPRRSRLEVHASSTFTGWQRITFDRWSAKVVRGKVVRVSVNVDMTSLKISLPDPAESVIKTRLLEVHKFPLATLEGTIHAIHGGAVPDAGEITVEGLAHLHGVRRAIRFVGSLAPDGAGYRFRARFLLSRVDFDIGFHDSWDTFLGDDVRIVLDIAGVEQKVEAEEVPVDPPLQAPP